MSKQSQGSMLLVGAISGGIGFVAAVALVVVGGFTLSPAIFMAIVIAGAAAVFLFSGFHGKDASPVEAAPKTAALTPSPDGKLGDVTRPAGTAGVEPGSAGHKVKSGTLLKGEEELAARKGDWRYEKAGAPAGAAENVSNAHGVDQSGTPFNDGDTKTDTDSSPGTEPTRLDAPRGDGPDDLKKIKGVGPKLEAMLHDMGIYHFDQIANWSDPELAWVDDNLEGFKGRASRDEWVSQARILAAGGETEFSKKSENGSA